mmetsp:Transcript_23603/g.34833  ORF Transcript_23603/g.34833 Transcript_23603/m.34833 type:complete len:491 (+) Transcript_23603:380-1852(+)|eukprot:CAMPEP_0194217030 /NCGR_PEP_ID=MMETSP0156-20130528/20153_1 /TAXON_ID=33649 /ORGANISM="Thalassionema nitzschioides, Strain L26-B" /LENGTH=490 /DNA_ID=CAMNT_0038945941 /DNA_START=297 /DNA_END=1772 /DNA_ORIENTATION=-
MTSWNGVQQPVFAPVSQQGNQLGDDIDLNEVFADYFISEFEDPLNAYTNAMGNYSGVAAALQQQQITNTLNAQTAAHTILTGQTPNPLAAVPQHPGAPTPNPLPTGGIRTAFHTKQVVAAPPSAGGNNGSVQQYLVANQQHQQQQPAVKKIRTEAGAAQPQFAQVPTNIGRGGITGRLGYSMIGGQLVHQAQQQQQAAVAAVPQPAPGGGGVQLPVGVGIRLGGIGGVAPSTVRPGQQYSNWPQQNQANMSEQAIAERRQRNREHAKRSRVRKKFMLESLQEQVRGLQKENVELRMLIQEKVPDKAQKIISECCSKNTLFHDPTDGTPDDEKKGKDTTALERSDFSLMESLTSGQQNFVLSDPRLPDNPIVYASPGFYTLTGYTPEQVLGRNCRFLQGPSTDPRAVDIIRKAVASGADATTCILNYKADGSPFWNQFFVAALRDSDNCIVNYVGVQCEVETEAAASALEDKVNSVLPLAEKEGGAAELAP